MEEIVDSPCVRNCCLNDEDICIGCFRSLQEITRWGTLNSQDKQRVLALVAQRKQDYLQKVRRG